MSDLVTVRPLHYMQNMLFIFILIFLEISNLLIINVASFFFGKTVHITRQRRLLSRI